MQYLIIGEWIENPAAPPQEVIADWENMVDASLKALAKAVEDKKAMGGVFAGERGGCIILESASVDEVGRFLRQLPFWGRMKWTVRPLESFTSVNELERNLIANLKKSISK